MTVETKLQKCHRMFIRSIHTAGNFFRRYFSTSTLINCKMTDWKMEKQQFLSMKVTDKRKDYKSKKYYTMQDISTWNQYAIDHGSLPEKIPALSDFEITPALSSELAKKISVFKGDITTLEVDVIVNAANRSLLGGGGVDGAIHSAAGPSLKQECQILRGCDVGEAKITGGYKLPAKYVIHTVGPRGEKPSYLSSCYKNSLDLMKTNNLRTIAFPCISTGIYGYPLIPAAHVATMEVRKHLEKNPNIVDRVIFCLFSDEDETIYQQILQSYFPLN